MWAKPATYRPEPPSALTMRSSSPIESDSLVILAGKEPEALQRQTRGNARKNFLRLMLALSLGLTIAVGFSTRLLPQEAEPRKPPKLPHPSEDEGKEKPAGVDTPETKALPTPEVTPADWNLPGMEEFEASLPPVIKEGKELLADLIEVASQEEERQAAEDQIPEDEKEMLAAVAKVVTHGQTDRLIGAHIDLESVSAFAASGVKSPASLRLKVIKFFRTGQLRVTVEAQDEATGEVFVLHFFVVDVKDPDEPIRSAARVGQQVLRYGEETCRLASAETPADVAAAERGLTVPLLKGNIAGVANVTRVDGFHINRQVELTPKPFGDLFHPLFLVHRRFSKAIPTKEYVAHRLLLEILHLQGAGVSHNGMHWGNFFTQPDGSFLLGGLEFAAPFGEKLHDMTQLNLRYSEPELIAEYTRCVQTGEPLLAHPSSDMWSTGILLYELFTNGSFPENFAEDIADGLVTSEDLYAQMIQAGAPQRWAELTVQLLTPTRESRITAKEVANQFSDLLLPEDDN